MRRLIFCRLFRIHGPIKFETDTASHLSKVSCAWCGKEVRS